MSADFGDHSAEIGAETPRFVAERLLRSMAEQAIRDGTLFVRDDRTVASQTEEPSV